MKLSARVAVELDAPFFVVDRPLLFMLRGKETVIDYSENDLINAPPTVQAVIEGYDVTVKLCYGLVDNPHVRGHHATGVTSLRVTISGSVSEFKPEDPAVYNDVQKDYNEILLTSINRLIDFCRYHLGTPYLRHLAGHIGQWEWLGFNGEVICEHPEGLILDKFPGFPGMKRSLECKALRKSDIRDLEEALREPSAISVVDHLRYQACEAVFDGDLMLATILLAISLSC